MLNNRQEDLSKVFDRTWKAKHNNDVDTARRREKAFMNRMFDSSQRQCNISSLTPGEKAEKLQNNINNAFIGQREAKVNNIVKKWK